MYAISEIAPRILWPDKKTKDIIENWADYGYRVQPEMLKFTAIIAEDDKLVRFAQPPSINYQRNVIYLTKRGFVPGKIPQIAKVAYISGIHNGLIMYSNHVNVKHANEFLERGFNKLLFDNGQISLDVSDISDVRYFF